MDELKCYFLKIHTRFNTHAHTHNQKHIDNAVMAYTDFNSLSIPSKKYVPMQLYSKCAYVIILWYNIHNCDVSPLLQY